MKRTLEVIEQDLASLDELEKFIDRQRSVLQEERVKAQRRMAKKNPPKDMLGTPCVKGDQGTYQEFDMWGQYLRCTKCRDSTPRWPLAMPA
jgi:hypothetical protein